MGKSTDESAGNPKNAPVFFPSAPREGAAPEAVIEDFYLAGSGYEDDYAVARQYLTQASSVTWKPDQRVLVFRAARVVPTGVENVFNYELDVSYSVDADGVATQLPEGTKENIPATLTQVDGEWRIAELPDGTAIPEETFKVIYGAYPIYFYDPTFTYAVPDVRWFIKKKTVKAMTSALLGGPAPYLKGAVVSAFPSGIKLARESVPVVSGAAQVDLTAKDLVEASNEDRLRMQTQLALTFRSQPDVVNVELRANQDLVRVEDNGSVLPPIRDNNVPAARSPSATTIWSGIEATDRRSGHPGGLDPGPRCPGGVARLAGRGLPQRRPRHAVLRGARAARQGPHHPLHPDPPLLRPVRLGLDGGAGRQRRHGNHRAPARRCGGRRRRSRGDAVPGLARRTGRQGAAGLTRGHPRPRHHGAERQDQSPGRGDYPCRGRYAQRPHCADDPAGDERSGSGSVGG